MHRLRVGYKRHAMSISQIKTLIGVTCWLVAAACATTHSSAQKTSHAAGEDEDALNVLTYDARVSAQDLHHATLTFPLRIHNAAAHSTTLQRIDWQLLVEGDAAQQGTASFSDPVAAGQQLEKTINLQINATAAGIRAYELQATVVCNTDNEAVAFAAEWQGKVLPSQAPTITVSPQAARYGTETVELNFAIGIANPNSFPLPIDVLDYVITVQDTQISQGHIAQGDVIPAASTLSFDVSRTIDRRSMSQFIDQIRNKKQLAYTMTNELRTEGLVLTQPRHGSIDFAR